MSTLEEANTVTMNIGQSYLIASREVSSEGIKSGLRAEPSLDEARSELSEAISRAASSIFKDKYGPLLGVVSQPAIYEFLKGFEAKLSRAKGDLTIVLEEVFDLVIPNILRKRN